MTGMSRSCRSISSRTAPSAVSTIFRRYFACAFAASGGRAGRGRLGPRVAHGPVERVVRHLFPAVLGEGGVGTAGVLLEFGERARLLLDLVGGARRHSGHGVGLAVG